MSEQEKIAAAEQRAAAAETAARRAEIQIEVLKMKAADFDKSVTERNDEAASLAVQALVRAGKINASDIWMQGIFKHKFLTEPDLVNLIFLKPANRKQI